MIPQAAMEMEAQTMQKAIKLSNLIAQKILGVVQRKK
jgi:hypothetical protein